ncbi:MAG: hypothetical protein HY742_03450 [Deltaproteobacteria bacterium]|nr:hypothetical protein [Deltaproteobacteria bacterium]
MIRCGFCGYEFSEEEGIRGCRNCPLGSGCKMVKCPRCNYEIPPEPEWVKTVKRLFRRIRFFPGSGERLIKKTEKEGEEQ